VRVPTDEFLYRDFGSKVPHVIERRRVVATLWRGGASAREITNLIRERTEKDNLRLEELGHDRRIPVVTMHTIRKDIQHIKLWIRTEYFHAVEKGQEEVTLALLENVRDALRLKAEAVDFDEQIKAIATMDNVARTFLKVIGAAADISVDVRKTEVKAAVTISGAPPEVRMAQEFIDAQSESGESEESGLGGPPQLRRGPELALPETTGGGVPPEAVWDRGGVDEGGEDGEPPALAGGGDAPESESGGGGELVGRPDVPAGEDRVQSLQDQILGRRPRQKGRAR